MKSQQHGGAKKTEQEELHYGGCHNTEQGAGEKMARLSYLTT
jgi:hypothetical protein